MSQTIHTDVLIIGAGPAGLMAANECRKRDIDCTLLEKKSERSHLSKALGIQSRTVELFELLNVHEPFLRYGYPGPGAKLHLGGKSPSLVELYYIQSRYPYMLVIPQNETERILEEHLLSMGGIVERNHEVVEVSQTEEYVSVSVTNDGITKEYQARYLLACDGAHSKVRQTLDVPFEGEDEGYTFFHGDVDIPEFHEIYINMFLNDRGAAAFFPYKDGSYRVVGMDCSKQGLPHKDELTLEELQESLNTILPNPPQVKNPVWLSYFGTAHRQVPNYREGRVFFVGDAAHIHNPLGGQGMNLGLQDASNIAWKLELVLKGYASETLLNSYHDERYPIAEDVLKETVNMLRVVNLSGALGKMRNWGGKAALTQGWIQNRVANRMSHIFFDYDKVRGNQLLKSTSLPKSAVQPGERVPDHLLFFDGSTDERLYPFIREHGHVCLIYIDAQDEDLIEYANQVARRMEKSYPRFISVYLVAKGGKVSANGDELPVIYDVHRHLDKKLGMKKGHTLLIRPDGHVGFHESSTDPAQIMKKVEQYLCWSE